MSAAHTPGPWFVWQERAMQEEGLERDEIEDELLHDSDFDVLAGTPVGEVTRGSILGCCSIVTVDSYNFGGRDEEAGKAEALANARLIAAAPELLEALKAVHDSAPEFWWRLPPLVQQQVKAALASAGGAQ